MFHQSQRFRDAEARLFAVVASFLAGGSVAHAQRVDVASPRTTVASESNLASVATGSACTIAITPVQSGQFNCRLAIDCGSSRIYGAGSSGFNVCVSGADGSVTVSDPNFNDGDPGLMLVLVRGRPATALLWSDTWRISLNESASATPPTVSTPAAREGAAGRGAGLPSTAPSVGAQRVPYASDCTASDQSGRVSVQCGGTTVACSRAATADAPRLADPERSPTRVELHSCVVGNRSLIALVSVQGRTRRVAGVAPITDRTGPGPLVRVQDVDVEKTAPLGPLPIDPNTENNDQARRVAVITWLDRAGTQWQSAVDTTGGATGNLGTFASCTSEAAANNNPTVCLRLRAHQPACALTHRWTLAIRSEPSEGTIDWALAQDAPESRLQSPFRFASIVADPITGLLSEPIMCELPFEGITSLHTLDYQRAEETGDAQSRALRAVIDASHGDFATALRAAGTASVRWNLVDGEPSIAVDYGFDYLPAPDRCPAPVVVVYSRGLEPVRWLVTYDRSTTPHAERISPSDLRLTVNMCLD